MILGLKYNTAWPKQDADKIALVCNLIRSFSSYCRLGLKWFVDQETAAVSQVLCG